MKLVLPRCAFVFAPGRVTTDVEALAQFQQFANFFLPAHAFRCADKANQINAGLSPRKSHAGNAPKPGLFPQPV
jgi:hypothetical protein